VTAARMGGRHSEPPSWSGSVGFLPVMRGLDPASSEPKPLIHFSMHLNRGMSKLPIDRPAASHPAMAYNLAQRQWALLPLPQHPPQGGG
jgi:hypothetical protein